MHKVRVVLSRRSSSGKYSEYLVCGCPFGKDHDSPRSITGQDDREYRVFGGFSSDRKRVIEREKWTFTEEDLAHLKSLGIEIPEANLIPIEEGKTDEQ